ncbi:MAG: ankyrin repeat domain-containing protein [Cytophagales bacterium]|nr:MAG: ankyrin repeat domain-containing protein [Cytophagales bacterium]
MTISELENFAVEGNLNVLKEYFDKGYTQIEIDLCLECALAYSNIELADYLLFLGADFSHYNYQGIYYAVHNNELKSLKYAISKGVNININCGMILNTSIQTCLNEKSNTLIEWILENGADRNLLTKNNLAIIDKYGTAELKELIKHFLS